MKLKLTYSICEVKCLIRIYINCMCKFDHGHGPLITHTGFRYGSWCTRKQPVKRL